MNLKYSFVLFLISIQGTLHAEPFRERFNKEKLTNNYSDIDLTWRDQSGNTYLMNAVRKIVQSDPEGKVLFDQMMTHPDIQSIVDSTDKSTRTPLFIALAYGPGVIKPSRYAQQVIKPLLAAGANPNLTPRWGVYPLNLAIAKKMQKAYPTAVVKVLLDHNAKANLIGHTVIGTARFAKQHDKQIVDQVIPMLKFLERNNVDLEYNKKNKEGLTVLESLFALIEKDKLMGDLAYQVSEIPFNELMKIVKYLKNKSSFSEDNIHLIENSLDPEKASIVKKILFYEN